MLEHNTSIPENLKGINRLPLLYVDDEQSNLDLFNLHYEDDFNIRTSLNADKALKILEKEDIGLIITDERMPGMTGIEFLERVVKQWPDTIRIIISAYNDADILLRAINSGHAHEYIVKPWDEEQLKVTLENSLRMVQNRRFLKKKAKLTDVMQKDAKVERSSNNIIAESLEMKQVMVTSEKIALTDAPVLIRGETGCGKEVIAQLIHDSSNRKNEPFVKVNCAAISEGVLESELFGHEKGAFTGALKSHTGRFELADSGTILLDEIGDISPKLQLSLLRVLQEQTFEKVGGTKTVSVDVRVIASTHQNLEEMIESGKFRSDLFFRLNVIPLHIPPLRERKSDIGPLLEFFVDKYKKKFLMSDIKIESDVIANLKNYNWPGNVREIENMVQRALAMNDTGTITMEDFYFDLRLKPQATLRDQIRASEEEKMRKALVSAGGNCSKAARAMGIPRTTFIDRAKRIGII